MMYLYKLGKPTKLTAWLHTNTGNQAALFQQWLWASAADCFSGDATQSKIMPTRQCHDNKQRFHFKNSFTPWAVATFGSASIPPGQMLETGQMRMHINTTCVTSCLVSSVARSLVPWHLDRDSAILRTPCPTGTLFSDPRRRWKKAKRNDACVEQKLENREGAERGASPLRPGWTWPPVSRPRQSQKRESARPARRPAPGWCAAGPGGPGPRSQEWVGATEAGSWTPWTFDVVLGQHDRR